MSEARSKAAATTGPTMDPRNTRVGRVWAPGHENDEFNARSLHDSATPEAVPTNSKSSSSDMVVAVPANGRVNAPVTAHVRGSMAFICSKRHQ